MTVFHALLLVTFCASKTPEIRAVIYYKCNQYSYSYHNVSLLHKTTENHSNGYDV